MIHELKTLPKYFDPIISGNKTFEIREFDRPYKVGDYLYLREWEAGIYSGRETIKQINYLLTDIEKYGLIEGYVILNII